MIKLWPVIYHHVLVMRPWYVEYVSQLCFSARFQCPQSLSYVYDILGGLALNKPSENKWIASRDCGSSSEFCHIQKSTTSTISRDTTCSGKADKDEKWLVCKWFWQHSDISVSREIFALQISRTWSVFNFPTGNKVLRWSRKYFHPQAQLFQIEWQHPFLFVQDDLKTLWNS